MKKMLNNYDVLIIEFVLALLSVLVLLNDNKSNANLAGDTVVNPKADLHLVNDTNDVGTCPLKFTIGTLIITPEDGAVEVLEKDLTYLPNNNK